jgi:hypothetical protein
VVAPTPATMSGMTVASVPNAGDGIVAALAAPATPLPKAVLKGGAMVPMACRNELIASPRAPICTLGLLIADWPEPAVVGAGVAIVPPDPLAGFAG